MPKDQGHHQVQPTGADRLHHGCHQAGDHEDAHYHKVATETTLVLSGQVSMLDRVWINGDIITISPGEITAFKALTDAVTVVVKVPGKLNDKFLD